MTGCNHSHGGPQQIKADHFTNAETVGETIDSAANNFFWGYGIARTINGPVDEMNNIIVGACFTLLAPGSIYAHRQLSKFHQHLAAQNSMQAPPHQTEDDHYHDIESATESTHIHANDSHHGHHEHAPLSKWQMGLLAMDYLSHIGDRSGAIVAMVSLFAADSIAPWAVGTIQIGATLFGAYTTWASVRNCKSAIEQQNGPKEEKHVHHTEEPTIQRARSGSLSMQSSN